MGFLIYSWWSYLMQVLLGKYLAAALQVAFKYFILIPPYGLVVKGLGQWYFHPQ
jgi:hypothetical protein